MAIQNVLPKQRELINKLNPNVHLQAEKKKLTDLKYTLNWNHNGDNIYKVLMK